MSVGIPGMRRKEVFYDVMEKLLPENKATLSTISRKLFSLECVNKGMSKYQARRAFNEKLSNVIEDIEYNTSTEKHILFIDKNHPPEAWRPTFMSIRPKTAKILVKRIALIPETIEPFNFHASGRMYSFPFSLSLLLQCLFEVQTRGEHENLPGIYSAMTVFQSFGYYTNVDLSGNRLQEKGFDYVMTSPFKSEDKSLDQKITNEMRLRIVEIIEVFRNGKPVTYENENLKVLTTEFLEKFEILSKNKEIASISPDIEVISNRIVSLLTKILELNKDEIIALEERARMVCLEHKQQQRS